MHGLGIFQGRLINQTIEPLAKFIKAHDVMNLARDSNI